jgi:(p)ppGpp synthase/HD superfamily hydrolase
MPTFTHTDLEKKAWDFAEDKHKGVRRKFLDASYFEGHLRKVFGLLKQYDTRAELGAASLLHDCLEDSDATYDELVEVFGKKVADLVKELTSDDEMISVMGKSDYLINKMLLMSNDALIIKLCDRLQNISDSYNASKSFRDKYYKETKYIIDRLKSERRLNRTQGRLVGQICGILDNIKSRYYESKKYVMTFEDFKVKNITNEDIIKCIVDGGSIYATIINNFPGNDPKIPLTPLSIDDDGLVTIELDGKNYEVDIKNIDKIS